MTSRAPLHPTRRLLLLALIVVVTQMLAMMHGVIHAAPDSVHDHHEAGVAHADLPGAHPETEAGGEAGWLNARQVRPAYCGSQKSTT